MEKKQSSVDWFFQQIRNNGGGFTAEDLFEWHKQAKAMHEKEVITAHENGYIDRASETFRTAENYYNETFNNETP